MQPAHKIEIIAPTQEMLDIALGKIELTDLFKEKVQPETEDTPPQILTAPTPQSAETHPFRSVITVDTAINPDDPYDMGNDFLFAVRAPDKQGQYTTGAWRDISLRTLGEGITMDQIVIGRSIHAPRDETPAAEASPNPADSIAA